MHDQIKMKTQCWDGSSEHIPHIPSSDHGEDVVVPIHLLEKVWWQSMKSFKYEYKGEVSSTASKD